MTELRDAAESVVADADFWERSPGSDHDTVLKRYIERLRAALAAALADGYRAALERMAARNGVVALLLNSYARRDLPTNMKAGLRKSAKDLLKDAEIARTALEARDD